MAEKDDKLIEPFHLKIKISKEELERIMSESSAFGADVIFADGGRIAGWPLDDDEILEDIENAVLTLKARGISAEKILEIVKRALEDE